MRIFILATVLLASSSLYPLFAQEEGKAPTGAPQTGAPAQTDQKSPQPPDQRIGRDQPRADDREMGHDGRMHRGDGDRMGRDDRETVPDWGMHRDREMGRDRDMDRRRYRERGDRDWDHADRDRDSRGYIDEDRPRHRVKVCVEYANGDEYCRYKE
jgi:hypothetical protein